MTDYAIGDLQGCLTPVIQLLAEVRFNPSADVLWVAGDLVNRGPESRATLDYLMRMEDSCRLILGNHDLSMLASYYGVRKPGSKDTIREIITHPDASRYISFIRRQPLIQHDRELGYTMTHAGIPSIWKTSKARRLAEEVSEILRNEILLKGFIQGMFGNSPDQWKDSLDGIKRWRTITSYFTRMRFISEQGKLDFEHKEAPDSPPPGMKAWFRFLPEKPRKTRLLFGHWAAMNGLFNHPKVIGLDTGYVWGGRMSLLNLQTEELIQVDQNGTMYHRSASVPGCQP